MNPEKLARLQQAAAKAGTTGPRRKVVKKPQSTAPSAASKSSGTTDDRRLMATLQRIRAGPIPGIDEVNMFDEDGRVIHFAAPRLHGAVSANVFTVGGRAEHKELTELLPGILTQLGADSLEALRRMASAMQQQQQQPGAHGGDGVPELVEDLESAEITEHKIDA